MSFVKLPLKIFKLGLDGYEIALFAALLSHSGKNSIGIFPSWKTLQRMTGGMSRDRLWKTLLTLSSCNIIQWETGKQKGKSSTYYVFGVGAWIKKTPSRGVRQTDTPCPPDGHPGVRQTDTNYISSNQISLTPENAVADEAEKARIAKQQIRMLAGKLKDMPH